MKIKLQKLQLKLTKLQNKIKHNNTRTNKNQINIILKQQKTAIKATKTRKLGSESDQLDLDFLKDNEGVKDSLAQAEAERKHQFDIDKIMLQAMVAPKQGVK